MSKKILQSVVIVLSILIVICFLFIVYGMYLKLSTTDNKFIEQNNTIVNNINENIEEYEKIKNIEVIDQNTLLIVIESSQNIRGAIYDIKKNKIISLINK